MGRKAFLIGRTYLIGVARWHPPGSASNCFSKLEVASLIPAK